ncbi:MAG TPA: hypothetical protein VIK78_00910 [Ruminiclostridium sp.]
MQNESWKIDSGIINKWSSKFHGWYHYPEHLISTQLADGMEFKSVDCPLVFQIEGDNKWYMFYTGFEGVGYQTMLVSSKDLICWENKGLVMSYGGAGVYDFGGVSFGGLLFQSYNLKDKRILKRVNGMYQALYGCYPKQGGYEIRPGAEGRAISKDGLKWERISNERPILSVDGANEWEKDCIYQPWLLEHDGKYYNFYNAANGIYEQIGVAFSEDLLNWERYKINPILENGEKGSYDEYFCSDGKVFYDEDHWVMFYFGVKIEQEVWSAHIMAAFSYDLLHWTKDSEPLYKAGDHPEGLDKNFAHKISIVFNPVNDVLYMYYNAVGIRGRGIGLITSKKII